MVILRGELALPEALTAQEVGTAAAFLLHHRWRAGLPEQPLYVDKGYHAMECSCRLGHPWNFQYTCSLDPLLFRCGQLGPVHILP
jgi:hypothetical protein